MSPLAAWNSSAEEAQEINQKTIAVKAKSYKDTDVKLKIGDNVRVLIQNRLKGNQNHTSEIYKISKVILGNGVSTIPRYKVSNLEGYYPYSKLLYIPDVEECPQIPKITLMRPKTTRTGQVY